MNVRELIAAYSDFKSALAAPELRRYLNEVPKRIEPALHKWHSGMAGGTGEITNEFANISGLDPRKMHAEHPAPDDFYDAVSEYSGDAYRDINALFRRPPDQYGMNRYRADQAKVLLDSMKPSTGDVVLHRGLGGVSTNDKLKDMLGAGLLEKYGNKGFASSSITPAIAESFGNAQDPTKNYRILVPSGTPMLPIGKMYGEDKGDLTGELEYLLPPNSRYEKISSLGGPTPVLRPKTKNSAYEELSPHSYESLVNYIKNPSFKSETDALSYLNYSVPSEMKNMVEPTKLYQLGLDPKSKHDIVPPDYFKMLDKLKQIKFAQPHQAEYFHSTLPDDWKSILSVQSGYGLKPKAVAQEQYKYSLDNLNDMLQGKQFSNPDEADAFMSSLPEPYKKHVNMKAYYDQPVSTDLLLTEPGRMTEPAYVPDEPGVGWFAGMLPLGGAGLLDKYNDQDGPRP